MHVFQFFSIFIVFLFTGCKSPEAIDTETKLESYKGDKLLLCAGNPDPAEFKKVYPNHTYTEDNTDWLTVDYDPIMRPDYLADLTKAETYDALSKKQFGIIVNEYCPESASLGIILHTSRLLKEGGILVSKVQWLLSTQDLKLVEQAVIQSGFSKVIFANIHSVPDIFKIKEMSPEEIIEVYENNEVTEIVQPPGKMRTLYTFGFIAIK